MKTDSSSAESRRNRLFLPALATASFASGPITVLGALLLIDIGNTFGTSVSVTGQIYTLYSIAAVIFALLTGALSIRFKHRSLLLAGLFLMAISAAGCFLALDFVTLLAFYSLSGAGYAIVNPMAFTLVGEHFPLEKRANAIGLIVAGGALVYVIGAPVIAVMSGYEGWRFPFLGFVLPILLISLLLAFLGLPSTSNKRHVPSEPKANPSPKAFFLNKSVVACLIGDTFRAAAFVAIMLYATSFFRQRFLIPTDSASIILLGGALSYVVGSLATGRFVNRMGRKSSAVLTALLSGTFTVSFVFVLNVWISLILMLIASWFFGMVASSANSLILEQIPELKGTLMSIDTAVLNAGSAFGTTAGGLALLYFGYEGLGSVLGTIGIVAALVFYLLAKDPTKPQ
ncbi:MAG: MFS transporter [Candidatus Bathyarchaeia archaeon]|jgi:predicted MFS family arabinose efflux permease